MRIGVVSDTHGNAAAVKRALMALPDAEAWIHLGDYASDSAALAQSGVPVYAVQGNCDRYAGAGAAKTEQIVAFEGVRVLAMHGHRYYVERDSNALCYRAQELNCQIVLYGHTHISEIEAWGSLLIVNPGSPSLPRRGRKPSIAVLDITGGDYSASIITL